MADCVPVLYPTEADMQRPFEEYIQRIEAQAWHQGIAIIQPPPSWSPRGPVPSRVSPRNRSGTPLVHPGLGGASAPASRIVGGAGPTAAAPAAPGRPPSGAPPADPAAAGHAAASAPAQAGPGAEPEAGAGAAEEPLPGAGYLGPDGLPLDDWVIPQPIRQHAAGSKGVFLSIHVVESKGIPVREFRAMAMAPQNCPSPAIAQDPLSLERAFWKNVTHSPPLYGADGVGSLFSGSRVREWNVARLGTLLSRRLEEEGQSIPGVTTAYLYFGMWRSVFAWHTEDMDLYSVNYLHFGKPKSWYVVPPAHRFRFERLAQSLAPNQFKACSQFLRHKETLISPHLLQQNSIPFIRAVQKPGQFVINFPGVYHAGFNQGYNCAESTNFATKRWIDLGLKARPCACRCDSVTIDMSLFLDSPSESATPSPPHLSPIGTPEEEGPLYPPAQSLTTDVSTALATKARPKSKSKGKGKGKAQSKAQAAAGAAAKKPKPGARSAMAAQGSSTAVAISSKPRKGAAAGAIRTGPSAPSAGAKRKGILSSGGICSGSPGPARPSKKAKHSRGGKRGKTKGESKGAPVLVGGMYPEAAGLDVAQGPGSCEAGTGGLDPTETGSESGPKVAGRAAPLARAQQRRAELDARLAQVAAGGTPGAEGAVSPVEQSEAPAANGAASPTKSLQQETHQRAPRGTVSLKVPASGVTVVRGGLLVVPGRRRKGGKKAAAGRKRVSAGGIPPANPLPTPAQPRQRKKGAKRGKGGSKGGVQRTPHPASSAPTEAPTGPVQARCLSCRRWRAVAPHHVASVLEQALQRSAGGSAGAQVTPTEAHAPCEVPQWAAAFRCAMLPGLTCRVRVQAEEGGEGLSASAPGAPMACQLTGALPSVPGGAPAASGSQQGAGATWPEVEAQQRLHDRSTAQPSTHAPCSSPTCTLQDCAAGSGYTPGHPLSIGGGPQCDLSAHEAANPEGCGLPALDGAPGKPREAGAGQPLESFVARMPARSRGALGAQARGVPGWAGAWEPEAGRTEQQQQWGLGELSGGVAAKQEPQAQGIRAGGTGVVSAEGSSSERVSAASAPRQVVEVVGREVSVVVLALPAAVPKRPKAMPAQGKSPPTSSYSPAVAGATPTRLQQGRACKAAKGAPQPEEQHLHSTLSLGEPVGDVLLPKVTPHVHLLDTEPAPVIENSGL